MYYADRLMGSVRRAGLRGVGDHPVAVIVEKLYGGIMMSTAATWTGGCVCALLALPSAVALGILAKPLTISFVSGTVIHRL